jgi:hypothetical protein
LDTAITPSKLQSTILYIITRYGKTLGAIELAKIIYLIDIEMMSLFSRTLTGEDYRRQEKGPLAINFGNQIAQMDGFELKVSIKPNKGNSGIPKHDHALGDQPRFQPVLDVNELKVIERVLNRIKVLSPIQIQNRAYETEPMKILLANEKMAGKKKLGEPIDFTVVKPDSRLTKWRENRNKVLPRDEKFDAFLAQEKAEINELITSWG